MNASDAKSPVPGASSEIILSTSSVQCKTALLTMSTLEVAASEPISADTHAEESDRDSAYSGSDASTYTESLRSSLLESLKENGRGYHKCLHLIGSRNDPSRVIVIFLLTASQIEVKFNTSYRKTNASKIDWTYSTLSSC